ncbi:MAG: respiratory nitrate reductase subunit gamma [Bdellovibrionales bacterium GWA2_49_15]|nr:MAG: respiratory nitrate reductase subunit gamma [Bdellovibrionales bacterium GWA2_49_15]
MTILRWAYEIFPYLAVFACLGISVLRYSRWGLSVSSLSSQFLEGQQLFWGSVPWHYGIGLVLLGHLFVFAWPGSISLLGMVPSRLLALEVFALVCGLLAVSGLIFLCIRRLTSDRVFAVTTKLDFVVLVLLLLQCLSGVLIAVFYRWGASWYAGTLVPYLWSLLTLKPDSTYVVKLPHLIQLHVMMAFLIIGLIPFTRLIHLFSIPFSYLCRPLQVVVWNRKK